MSQYLNTVFLPNVEMTTKFINAFRKMFPKVSIKQFTDETTKESQILWESEEQCIIDLVRLPIMNLTYLFSGGSSGDDIHSLFVINPKTNKGMYTMLTNDGLDFQHGQECIYSGISDRTVSNDTFFQDMEYLDAVGYYFPQP